MGGRGGSRNSFKKIGFMGFFGFLLCFSMVFPLPELVLLVLFVFQWFMQCFFEEVGFSKGFVMVFFEKVGFSIGSALFF